MLIIVFQKAHYILNNQYSYYMYRQCFMSHGLSKCAQVHIFSLSLLTKLKIYNFLESFPGKLFALVNQARNFSWCTKIYISPRLEPVTVLMEFDFWSNIQPTAAIRARFNFTQISLKGGILRCQKGLNFLIHTIRRKKPLGIQFSS